MRRAHEHLAQRRPAFVDVEQPHGPDDSPFIDGDPEVAAVALVEARDVAKVGLRIERDGNRELALLDRQDHRDDTGGVVRRERDDLDHGSPEDAQSPIRSSSEAAMWRIVITLSPPDGQRSAAPSSADRQRRA